MVDDDPDICWVLEETLRSAGYRVSTAGSGAEALQALEQQGCAVAFVDAKLPDLEGLELAKALRERSPRTAVVLISAYYYEGDQPIREGLEKGLLRRFLAKPFDLDTVRLVAQQGLECSSERREADGSHSGSGR